MVDVTLKVPALEKLVDYTASGIGAVAGPMLAPWKARKEAEARLIEARGEADSLKLIADAQAEARHSLAMPTQAGRGVLEIDGDGIRQRIEFQEGKRQANIASVVRGCRGRSRRQGGSGSRARSRLDGTVLRRRSGRLVGGHAKDLVKNPVGRSRGAGTDVVAYTFDSKGYVATRCRSFFGPDGIPDFGIHL